MKQLPAISRQLTANFDLCRTAKWLLDLANKLILSESWRIHDNILLSNGSWSLQNSASY
jgi:hypothetical protein